MSKGKEALLAVFVAITFILLGGIYFAFVFSRLWELFMVPTFGLPVISMQVAYGISIIFGMLKGLPETKKSDDDESAWAGLIGRFIGQMVMYTIAWGVGVVVAGL